MINGKTVIRRSELGPLTGTVYTYKPVNHFSVVRSGVALDTGLMYTRPFTYTVNGATVVRISELGPFTGRTSIDPATHLPGHDYGVLGNAPEIAITLPPQKSFSYTVHGELVVRR